MDTSNTDQPGSTSGETGLNQTLDSDLVYRESIFYKLLLEHDVIYVEKVREQLREMTMLANVFVKNGQTKLYKLTTECIQGLKYEIDRWTQTRKRSIRYEVQYGRKTTAQDDTSTPVHRDISFICKESH